MIVSVSLADDELDRYASRLDTTARNVRSELSKGLNDAGFTVFTDVRRALRDQMNTRSVAVVNRHTKSKRAAPTRLEYTMTGTGRGLLIQSGFRYAVSGPVSSDPWARGRTFQRSFRNGALMARLGPARYPVRWLYGPSPAKEIVKDDTLQTFEDGVARIVRPRIAARLARLLGDL